MGYYIPNDMWEAIEEQPKTVQNAVLGAVARLFFTGVEEHLNGTAKSIYAAFRTRVMRSRTNEMNRRGKTNETRNETRNEISNETGKETGNETSDETGTNAGTNEEGNSDFAIKGGGRGREELTINVNSNNPPIAPPAPPYEQIIGYLNAKTGKAFKHTSESTRKLIRARIAEGYTVADFYRVIDNKCLTWKNDQKMRDYLRPSTLFRASNFEGYLNERAKEAYDADPYRNAF